MDRDGWSDPPRPTPAWRRALGLGPIGLCRALDDDDQLCVLRAGHRGSHRNTGVRAWLERTNRNAIIRTYEGSRGSDHLMAERVLFGAFGFRPIAHEEARWVSSTGPGPAAILVFGWIAALGSSTPRRRRLTVCYPPCDTGPWTALAGVPADEPGHPWPDEDPDDAEVPWPDDGRDEPPAPIDPPG